MSDIVNLNRIRKKKRAEKNAAAAAENRAKFGRSKRDKLKDQSEAAARARLLDGARLESDDEAGV